MAIKSQAKSAVAGNCRSMTSNHLRSRRPGRCRLLKVVSAEALDVFRTCLARLDAAAVAGRGAVIFRSDRWPVPVNKIDVQSAVRLLRRRAAGRKISVAAENCGGRQVLLVRFGR